MKKAENNICPRCLGPVPNEEYPGEYPGALSRVDNETEICSACGTDEAITQFLNNGLLQPISMWPIKRDRTHDEMQTLKKVIDDAQ